MSKEEFTEKRTRLISDLEQEIKMHRSEIVRLQKELKFLLDLKFETGLALLDQYI